MIKPGISIILFAVLAVVSCQVASGDRDPAVRQETVANWSTPETADFTDGRVEFENVAFDFDREWIERVQVTVLPEDKLLEEDRKPDGVGGRTLKFDLQYRNSDDKASISVFKIAEYIGAFSRFPQYVEKRDQDLKSLLKNPSKIKKWGIDKPVHVRWMDAHHDFYAKAAVTEFGNGRGLFMLTQIGQDGYTVINNEQLEYFFQGLTNDGVYFVEMSFPANMDGLRAEYSSEVLAQFGLPKDCCYSKPEYHDTYNRYKSGIARKIDAASASSFAPSVDKIQSFVGSFRIR